ncbi:MAG: C39 family peptidase [Thermodesulfovibrionales bacterium]|nr:C39 family peptidase [Thermodesulfovibrionales bacterium]
MKGDKTFSIDRILLLFLLTISISLMIISCKTGGKIPDASDARVISNVPFYQQETYQCGPSSLASILNYWNLPMPPEQIAEEIFSKSARGTLNLDLILYAQGKGLYAEQYRGGVESLKTDIDAGFPLIVMVDYGFSLYQQNHFMVVLGYSEKGIIAHTGRSKEKVVLWDDFLRSWEKTGYWTLLIKKKSA